MNLNKCQDKEYQKFTSKLCSTKYPIIGVRLPTLRLLAKDLNMNNLKEFN